MCAVKYASLYSQLRFSALRPPSVIYSSLQPTYQNNNNKLTSWHCNSNNNNNNPTVQEQLLLQLLHFPLIAFTAIGHLASTFSSYIFHTSLFSPRVFMHLCMYVCIIIFICVGYEASRKMFAHQGRCILGVLKCKCLLGRVLIYPLCK